MDDLGDLDRSVDTLLVEFESVAETDEHNTMLLRSYTYKGLCNYGFFNFSVLISCMNDLELLTFSIFLSEMTLVTLTVTEQGSGHL